MDSAQTAIHPYKEAILRLCEAERERLFQEANRVMHERLVSVTEELSRLKQELELLRKKV